MPPPAEPPLLDERTYHPWWLRALATVLPLLATGYIYRNFEVADVPEFRVVLVVAGLLGALVPNVVALRLRLYRDRIVYGVHPVPGTTRTVPLADIARLEPQTYHPLWDFGGWGVRYSPRRKLWAYVFSSGRGVLVWYGADQRVFLETAYADQLRTAYARGNL